MATLSVLFVSFLFYLQFSAEPVKADAGSPLDLTYFIKIVKSKLAEFLNFAVQQVNDFATKAAQLFGFSSILQSEAYKYVMNELRKFIKFLQEP